MNCHFCKAQGEGEYTFHGYELDGALWFVCLDCEHRLLQDVVVSKIKAEGGAPAESEEYHYEQRISRLEKLFSEFTERHRQLAECHNKLNEACTRHQELIEDAHNKIGHLHEMAMGPDGEGTTILEQLAKLGKRIEYIEILGGFIPPNEARRRMGLAVLPPEAGAGSLEDLPVPGKAEARPSPTILVNRKMWDQIAEDMELLREELKELRKGRSGEVDHAQTEKIRLQNEAADLRRPPDLLRVILSTMIEQGVIE